MDIRFATPADSAALLRIYAQYIDTPVTFEYKLPSEQEFARRIETITAEYPYLVCAENGELIAYAYAHRLWERAAYQWNAELSIYLCRTHTSRGIGKRLYHILAEMLRLCGIRTVYGIVTLPNEKSERLHLSLGFHRCATYRNAGYKCGRWHDVAWFEKEIAPHSETAAPSPVLPLSAIPTETLDAILGVCQPGYPQSADAT